MSSPIETFKTRVLSFSKGHKRMMYVIAAAVIFPYFLFTLLFSDLGLIKYISMRGEYNRIRSDISRLERENKKLKEEVDALKTDPDYIEALARERLGMAREGEIIYKFMEKERQK